MVSVAEAKKIITQNISALKPVRVSLETAAGLILAADVFATSDIPAFRQSSMDGYAIAFDDLPNELSIAGEAAAGSSVITARTAMPHRRI